MEDIIKKIKDNGEDKILKIIENFNEEEREEVLKEVSKIDFEKINELYNKRNEKNEDPNKKLEPIDFLDINKITEEEKRKYEVLGEEIIKQGKYAVITMAGGQRNKAWT